MLYFYARLSILLVLLLTLCGFALSALGSTQPINPALRGFVEGCEGLPQPCWYGIVLGVTTSDEVMEIIQSEQHELELDYQAGNYWSIFADDCMVGLWLGLGRMSINCPANNLRVGDLMGIWGSPQNMFIPGVEKIGFLYHDERVWGFCVLYNPEIVSLLPSADVSEIFVSRNYSNNENVWRGYQLLWNYPRLDFNVNYTQDCIPPRGDDNPTS